MNEDPEQRIGRPRQLYVYVEHREDNQDLHQVVGKGKCNGKGDGKQEEEEAVVDVAKIYVKGCWTSTSAIYCARICWAWP